ncbi:MAG: hypothetical protein HY078_10035 [Elusimicrobia bacterium]|nr:hypothetical protein [Elusimicrobiota bacterium]
MSPSPKEHRRHVRYERALKLTIFGMDMSLLDETTNLSDVSRKGMKFETVANIKPGDYFRFKLEVPDYGFVDGKGRARWSQVGASGVTYVIGAEITSMGWGASRALKRFLEPGRTFFGVAFDLALGAGALYVLWQIVNQLNAG